MMWGKEVQRSTYCQTKRLVPLTGNDLLIAKIAAASGPYCFSGNTDVLGCVVQNWAISHILFLPSFSKLNESMKTNKTEQMKTCIGELLLAEFGRKAEIIMAGSMSAISEGARLFLCLLPSWFWFSFSVKQVREIKEKEEHKNK